MTDPAPEQFALPYAGTGTRPPVAAFTLDQVRALPNEQAAIDMSVRCSGLQEKEVALALGIDLGQWSRICSGSAHFPHLKRNAFMDIVGSEILLIFGVESRGYDWSSLRYRLDDKDRQLAEKDARIADLERALALVIEHHKGRP